MATASTTTILAIDDEQAVLERITSTLEGAGYSCLCAASAQAADAILRQTTPDLILIDVNLNGHSGVALCELYKQQQSLADVPVMFLSSMQGPDIIRRRQGSSTCYHIRKPLDAPVLLRLVEQAVPSPHFSQI